LKLNSCVPTLRLCGGKSEEMQRSRAQIQLQYHQTLNRIAEMEVLAEQLARLADSYRKEEQRKRNTIRETDSVYQYGYGGENPAETLQEQAGELRSAAEDWYRRAREEYRSGLQAIRQEEEQRKTW